jgi:acylphosphatase
MSPKPIFEGLVPYTNTQWIMILTCAIYQFCSPLTEWKILMTKHLSMRCYVSGTVQGVWFRASAKDEADKLEISGWARNLTDGRVEVFACGTENQLELFYSWLKHGPQLAKVNECTREHLPWEEYTGFDIL